MNAKPSYSPFVNHASAVRAGEHGSPPLWAVGLRLWGHDEQRAFHAFETGLLLFLHFPALAAFAFPQAA